MATKNMQRNILIAAKSHLWLNHQIDDAFLMREKLLKTLSLLLASRASLPVPSTLLLLEWNETILKDIIYKWQLPLMIRMDYKSLPKKKTLGGIPLYTYDVINKVSTFLFEKKCYPVLHPNLDRFDDEYSVGILLKPDEYKYLIEIVGEGFDASDLRLGGTHSHEFLQMDILGNSPLAHSVINKSDYEKERQSRIKKAIKLKKYIDYVNKEGKLSSSLDIFTKTLLTEPEYTVSVPKEYRILPDSYLSDLKQIVSVLHAEVIKKLPFSSEFVASLSYIKHKGWLLWDVYGQWYAR